MVGRFGSGRAAGGELRIWWSRCAARPARRPRRCRRCRAAARAGASAAPPPSAPTAAPPGPPAWTWRRAPRAAATTRRQPSTSRADPSALRLATPRPRGADHRYQECGVDVLCLPWPSRLSVFRVRGRLWRGRWDATSWLRHATSRETSWLTMYYRSDDGTMSESGAGETVGAMLTAK